jgi:hypothetical protein
MKAIPSGFELKDRVIEALCLDLAEGRGFQRVEAIRKIQEKRK